MKYSFIFWTLCLIAFAILIPEIALGQITPPELLFPSISSIDITQGETITVLGIVKDDCIFNPRPWATTLTERITVKVSWGDGSLEETKLYVCPSSMGIDEEFSFTHRYRELSPGGEPFIVKLSTESVYVGETVQGETKDWTVTVRPPCKEEGESIPLISNPPECCEGLTLIGPPDASLEGNIEGVCTANCGDGECDSPIETNYNCPEDCREEPPPEQDDKPTISLDNGAIYGERKVNEETSLSLTATDDNGVSKIEINWGDNETDSYDFENCGGAGDTSCTKTFAHTYRDSGEFWIESWATDTKPQESEHKRWIRIIEAEGEERVGISVENSPTGVTGRAITVDVTAWHSDGIDTIFLQYDDDTSSRSKDCPGDPGQCIRTWTRTYNEDEVGTRGGKVWAFSGTLKSPELPFSYEIIKSDGDGDGDGDGDEDEDEEGETPSVGLIEVTNPLKAKSFEDFINKLVSFLFTISLVVVPILLVIAGIMFLTAQGAAEKVSKAKKMILYTLIGFGIISLAKIFVKFIFQIFLE